jgi:hypothetical protein
MVGVLDRNTEANHEIFEHGEKSMGPAIEQDMAVFIQQQKGFRSRGFKGPYLSGQESRVGRYHELINDYVEGRRPKRGQT